MVRGWKDWVRGIAIWGIGPNDELTRIRTDERGYLQVLQVPHHHTHEDGGSDEINVQGLSGVLADLQRGKFSFVGNWNDFPAPGEPDRLAFAVDQLTVYRDTGTEWQKVATAHWDYLEGAPSDYFPSPHASTHEEGGSDAINPVNIGANWNKLVNKPSTFPPSAHASSHQPGGSDALPTAVPSPITEGATGAEGSSTALARADHVHEAPSEWTPKEHGNEKHNPDFLAVDGSNQMQADLVGPSAYPYKEIRRWVFNLDLGQVNCCLFPFLQNDLAYNTKRGGSVSFSVTPDIGAGENLFDGKGTYVRWNNPTGTIQVTVNFWRNFQYATYIGFVMVEGARAKDFTIEVYDATNAEWVTVVSETEWQTGVYVRNYGASHPISALRLTFSNFADSSWFGLREVFLVWGEGESTRAYMLPRDGGDMYGNIDMHGNDIVNPGLVDGVDVSAHAARHENGGADEINVQGLSGQLADPQKTTWDLVANKPSSFNPSAHGSRHEVGGSDEVRPGKYVNQVLFSSSSTVPSSYSTLSTGIGCRALVLLRVYNNSGADRRYFFYPGDESSPPSNANTDATLGATPIFVGADAKVGYTWMITDASGNLKWKALVSHSGVTVTLLAYIKLA